ncbi:zinc finger protein 420-like [Phlebotomus argentipes]|uniref:zinc finger protein 420-like n=1 Tax=Phlebotomus argentipes TaxID=94469 RepID=UPI0028937A31|nr:zinc finger protein 420-like [Phlebotomus argentipes]
MPDVKLELFSVKQRVFLVKHFYQSFGDYKLVKSDYETFYGAPQFYQLTDEAIAELIELFEDTGSVLKSIRMMAQKVSGKEIPSLIPITSSKTEVGSEVSAEETEKSTTGHNDPLEDLDCFTKEEYEVQEADEVIHEEYLEEAAMKEKPSEKPPKQSVHSIRAQKIRVIRMNELLEETIEYTDDEDQLQEVESSIGEPEGIITCLKCDKKCKTLKEHKCFLLSCTYCRKKFPRKDLVKHMKRNHNNRKLHSCEFCGKFFIRKDDMLSHRRIHTKETPFTCRAQGCNAKFHWRAALNRHELLVHIKESTERYKCNFCPASYRLKEYVVSHMKRWHDYKETDSETVTEESCHKTWNGPETAQNSSLRPFICSFKGCGKSFCWRQSQKRHEQSHKEDNNDNRLKCEYCFYFSYSQKFLDKHMAKEHISPHQEISSLGTCDNCNENIPNGQTHCCDLVTCLHCREKFSKSEMTRHYQIKHAQEKQVCQVCGKRFHDLQAFLNHQKIHEDQQRLYVCSTCGKICQRKYDLQSHEKVHSQDRPYTCQIETCRRSFAWLHSLRRHEKLHETKNAKLSCKFCDKFFVTKPQMSAHLMRNHQCGKCWGFFKTRDELLRHKETHAGEEEASEEPDNT